MTNYLDKIEERIKSNSDYAGNEPQALLTLLVNVVRTAEKFNVWKEDESNDWYVECPAHHPDFENLHKALLALEKFASDKASIW